MNTTGSKHWKKCSGKLLVNSKKPFRIFKKDDLLSASYLFSFFLKRGQ